MWWYLGSPRFSKYSVGVMLGIYKEQIRGGLGTVASQPQEDSQLNGKGRKFKDWDARVLGDLGGQLHERDKERCGGQLEEGWGGGPNAQRVSYPGTEGKHIFKSSVCILLGTYIAWSKGKQYIFLSWCGSVRIPGQIVNGKKYQVDTKYHKWYLFTMKLNHVWYYFTRKKYHMLLA